MIALIIFILIIVLSFGVFIIVFAVKFLKLLFASFISASAANANPNTTINSVNGSAINGAAVTGSDEFNQFCSKRTEYWNEIIKQQKSRGVFDEKNLKIHLSSYLQDVK